VLTQLSLELRLADALGHVIHDLAGAQVALKRAVVGDVRVRLAHTIIGHHVAFGALTTVASGRFRGENAEGAGGLAGILGAGIAYWKNKTFWFNHS